MKTQEISPKLQLLLFILEHSQNISDMTEMKIYKLMYFLDKEYFETYGKSFAGDIFVKNYHGPVVRSLKSDKLFDELIDLKNSDGKKFYNLKNNNFILSLKEDERDTLNNGLERYKRLSAWQLRTLSHTEAPYLMSLKGEKIDMNNIIYNQNTDTEEDETEELVLTTQEKTIFLKNLEEKYG